MEDTGEKVLVDKSSATRVSEDDLARRPFSENKNKSKSSRSSEKNLNASPRDDRNSRRERDDDEGGGGAGSRAGNGSAKRSRSRSFDRGVSEERWGRVDSFPIHCRSVVSNHPLIPFFGLLLRGRSVWSVRFCCWDCALLLTGLCAFADGAIPHEAGSGFGTHVYRELLLRVGIYAGEAREVCACVCMCWRGCGATVSPLRDGNGRGWVRERGYDTDKSYTKSCLCACVCVCYDTAKSYTKSCLCACVCVCQQYHMCPRLRGGPRSVFFSSGAVFFPSKPSDNTWLGLRYATCGHSFHTYCRADGASEVQEQRSAFLSRLACIFAVSTLATYCRAVGASEV